MKREATASYQWEGGGIIQRVDIRTQANGRAVAYIYADNDNARQPERNVVRAAFRGKGWGTLSDHSGEQFSLRVSGITDPQELIRLITEHGYAVGQPTATDTMPKVEKAKGVGGFIKDNSLQISAIVYTIGNGLYWLSGRKAKIPEVVDGIETGKILPNKDRMKMAASFAVGDAALGLFGGNDDARQYKALLGKLKHHMEADGIDIPKTASIHVETAPLDEGLYGKFRDFMHTHINSIKMMAEVAGGGFAFADGWKKSALKDKAGEYILKDGEKIMKRNPYMIAGGSIVMLGWAGALLTKEKKRDPETSNDAGTLQKVSEYIHEKPLRLAGYAGLAFNTVGAANFIKEGGASGKWGLGAVATMVGANGAYAISHKAPGGNIKEDAMVSDVYTVAAQIINKQPDTLRDAAIESTAKFLGERPEIKDTHSQIIERLKKEVVIQRQNPWFENTRLAIRNEPQHAIAAGTPDVALAKEAPAPAPSTAIHTAGSVHEATLDTHGVAHDAPTAPAL